MAGEDNRVYGFRKLDAEQLIQKLGEGKGFETLTGNTKGVNYIAMTPGGGIAARSGTTITSADCTVYTGEGGTLATAGFDVPIYNLSTTAIAGNTYVVAVWASGVLVAVWEDCVGA
jgi:hypothetical protein